MIMVAKRIIDIIVISMENLKKKMLSLKFLFKGAVSLRLFFDSLHSKGAIGTHVIYSVTSLTNL